MAKKGWVMTPARAAYYKSKRKGKGPVSSKKAKKRRGSKAYATEFKKAMKRGDVGKEKTKRRKTILAHKVAMDARNKSSKYYNKADRVFRALGRAKRRRGYKGDIFRSNI